MSKYIANIAINKCVYHLSNHHSTGSALFGHSRFCYNETETLTQDKNEMRILKEFLIYYI